MDKQVSLWKREGSNLLLSKGRIQANVLTTSQVRLKSLYWLHHRSDSNHFVDYITGQTQITLLTTSQVRLKSLYWLHHRSDSNHFVDYITGRTQVTLLTTSQVRLKSMYWLRFHCLQLKLLIKYQIKFEFWRTHQGKYFVLSSYVTNFYVPIGEKNFVDLDPTRVNAIR